MLVTALFMAIALGGVGMPDQALAMGKRPVASGAQVRLRLPPAGRALPLPKVHGPDDRTRPLVVIDAGHGGHDPGAIASDGGREEALTLALALQLRDTLVGQGRVRVALTRETDRYLLLEERSDIARRLGADLFVSLHADAANLAEVTGASVYTLSDRASDAEAARIATRENAADSVNGVTLAGRSQAANTILAELSLRRVSEQSRAFARLVAREGEGLFPLRKEPVRTAAFIVLKNPDMASALVEAGYLSNPEDAARLASQEGRARFATGLARAITIYLARATATR